MRNMYRTTPLGGQQGFQDAGGPRAILVRLLRGRGVPDFIQRNRGCFPDGRAVHELPHGLTQVESEATVTEAWADYLGNGYAILEDLTSVRPLPAQY